MAMMILVIVIYVGVAMVPLFGLLAAPLLTPLLAAGMLCACQRVAREERLDISDLFIACQRHGSPLVMLGVFYMLAMLGVFLLLFLFVGGGVAGGLLLGNPLGVGFALGSFLFAGFLWLLLSLPILMALWFAPALVLFNRMPPADALRASFRACVGNAVALLLHAVLAMLLCFLAVLPAGLGLLVIGPILAGSVYASYRDIFIAA
jgi:uncharacterized membrane protein